MTSKHKADCPEQLDMRDLVAFMPMVEFIETEKPSAKDSAYAPSGGFYWSDAGVRLLKEKLLLQSTRSLLDSRCSKATWDDVTSWIVCEDDDNPFSFDACCESMGVEPNRYREAVFDMVLARQPKFDIPAYH